MMQKRKTIGKSTTHENDPKIRRKVYKYKKERGPGNVEEDSITDDEIRSLL